MKMRRFIATILVAVMLVSVLSSAVMASEVSRETVQEVQQALNDAGFDCGTPDGAAGDKTKKAISEYQQANGLEVTGEITEELLATLFPTEEVVPKGEASEAEAEQASSETEYVYGEEMKLEGYDGTTNNGHKFKWFTDRKVLFVDGPVTYYIGPYDGQIIFARIPSDKVTVTGDFTEENFDYWVNLSASPTELKTIGDLMFELFLTKRDALDSMNGFLE